MGKRTKSKKNKFHKKKRTRKNMKGGSIQEEVMKNNLNKLVFKNEKDFKDFMETGDLEKVKQDGNGNFGFIHMLSKYSRDYIDLFKKLIEHPVADINLKSINGYTALIIASLFSNNTSSEETVKLLLQYPNIDVNIQDYVQGNSALIFSSNFSNTTSSEETVRMLLQHSDINVNLHTNDGNTALIFSSLYSNTTSSEETVKLLLQHPNIDVNIQDYNEGNTALIMASAFTNDTSTEETVRMLLEHPDINVNLQDNDGHTALIIASNFSNTTSSEETVRMLLQHTEIDVNMQDYNGATALIIASDLTNETSSEDTIKLLLQHPNINVNIENNQGETAYDIIKIRNPQSDLLERLKPKEEDDDVEEFSNIKIDINKSVNFFDPIMQQEEEINIKDYLQEDTNNIVIVYGNNKDKFFFTERSTINSLKENGVYPCKNANGLTNPNNILPEIELFKVRSIGLHTNTEYVKINKLIENPQHQLFVIFKSSKRYPAFISKKVHDEPGTSIVSALHCQEGYGSNIGILELAYKKGSSSGAAASGSTRGGRRKKKAKRKTNKKGRKGKKKTKKR